MSSMPQLLLTGETREDNIIYIMAKKKGPPSFAMRKNSKKPKEVSRKKSSIIIYANILKSKKHFFL